MKTLTFWLYLQANYKDKTEKIHEIVEKNRNFFIINKTT